MARRRLRQDLYLILASLIVAWAIVRFDLVSAALAYTGDGVLLAALLAGAFFTSIVTTAPAIAVLGELSLHMNLFVLAVLGGAGAVAGDYLIFLFVRDRISADAAYLLRGPKMRRALHVFKNRHFRRVLPLIGGLIIASPLPDELGLALLGLGKMRTSRFVILSFFFNFIGIVLIGLAARGLA